MSLFICEKCGAIENTALGFYWSRKIIKFKDEDLNGKALCSECMPTIFSDGTKAGNGRWHNRFPKEFVEDHPNGNYCNWINGDFKK